MDIIKAPPLKIPDKQDILPSNKYLLSVKIGGEMQLIDVYAVCMPYQQDINKGRKAWYVDVTDYNGYKGSVNIKKLRCLPI